MTIQEFGFLLHVISAPSRMTMNSTLNAMPDVTEILPRLTWHVNIVAEFSKLIVIKRQAYIFLIPCKTAYFISFVLTLHLYFMKIRSMKGPILARSLTFAQYVNAHLFRAVI